MLWDTNYTDTFYNRLKHLENRILFTKKVLKKFLYL